jgi:hypothetical protein
MARRSHVFLCSLSILIGLTFSFFAIQNGLHGYHFSSNSITANGSVTSFKKTSRTDQSGTYFVYTPIVSFVDNKGQSHEISGSLSDPNPSERIGTNVTVLYPSLAPQEARIFRFTELYLAATILGGFALLFLLMGLLPLVLGVYRNKKISALKTLNTKVDAIVTDINQTYVRQGLIVHKFYYIKATYTDKNTNQHYSFSSKKYRGKFNKQPNIAINDIVKVLIDPTNPQKEYFMVIDE